MVVFSVCYIIAVQFNRLEPFNHRQFNLLYRRLFHELAEIGLNNFKEYHYSRIAGNYNEQAGILKEIEYKFTCNCVSLLERIPEDIINSDGITVLLTNNSIPLSESAEKQLTVYSNSTIILCNSIGQPDYSFGEDFFPEITLREGPDVRDLIETAFKHRSNVVRGNIIPLPSAVNMIDIDMFESTFWNLLNQEGEDIIRQKKYLSSKYTKDLLKSLKLDPGYSAEHDYVSNASTIKCDFPGRIFKLSTDGAALGSDHNVIKVGLRIPSFENIPLGTILKLREDYQNEFIRFQRALEIMSFEMSNLDDESRLKYIMARVEHELHELDMAVEHIRKAHNKLNIAKGVLALVLYFSIKDPAILSSMNTLLSGIGVAAYYEFFRDIRDTKNRIEASPLFFPLIVSRKGKFN